MTVKEPMRKQRRLLDGRTARFIETAGHVEAVPAALSGWRAWPTPGDTAEGAAP